jgi:hypothetical protein
VARDHAKTIEIVTKNRGSILQHLVDDDLQGWFFRGQARAEWKLLSAMGRLVTEDKLARQIDPLAFENSLFGEFKRTFYSSQHLRPDDHDLNGWLALMQHYRAPTRLLDWTTSPLVALYFATQGLNDDYEGAVWAFNPLIALGALGDNAAVTWDHFELWRVKSGNSALDETSRETFQDFMNYRTRELILSKSRWPFPFAPKWVDPRMAAQQSVFTVAGDVAYPFEKLSYQKNRVAGVGEDIQKWLRQLLPTDIFRKIIIPRESKTYFQTYLHRLGISAASLFPGLDGLGDSISKSEDRLIPINDYIPGAANGFPIRRKDSRQ